MISNIIVLFQKTHNKDLKMVLDAALLNTQHYKVRIRGKVNPLSSKLWVK